MNIIQHISAGFHCSSLVNLPVHHATALTVRANTSTSKYARVADVSKMSIWTNYSSGTSPKYCHKRCCWQWEPSTWPYGGGYPRNVTAYDLVGIAQSKILADVVVSMSLPHPPDWPVMNKFHISMIDCIQPGTIIFVETPDLPFFFQNVFDKLPNPFILLTGDSDQSAPARFLSFLNDKKILHWSAMNCDVDARLIPKLSCLPLGVSHWASLSPLLALMRIGQGIFEGVFPSLLHPKNAPGRPLIFASFSVRAGVRQQLWNLACSTGGRLRNITTCSADFGSQTLPVKETLLHAAKHAFVLSPPGIGLDTWRWVAHFFCAK